MTTATVQNVEVTPRPATVDARSCVHHIERLAWLIVAAGAVLRVVRYAANRSLWLDEVLLATNILTRSFRGLLAPLDNDQGAPVGFLILEKLAVTIVGGSEYGLRLVPLIAGLVSLPLFWFVARRLLDVRIALLATALFAVCEPLIYYSSEAKQYGVDVVVTLAIVLAALRVMEEPAQTARLVTFAIVGLVSVWFSHPAVFVLAGTGATIIIWEWLYGRRSDAFRLAAVAALWVVSFGLHYVLFMRALGKNNYLMEYWTARGGFMPWPPGPRSVTWFPRAFWEVFRDRARAPVNLLLPEIAIFAFVLGVVGLFLKTRKVLVFLAAPVALALLAAVVRKYPFSERLILFTTPLFLLVIAAGVGFVYDSVGQRGRLIAVLLAAALLLPSAANAAKNLVRPPGREEMKPVLRHVAKNWRAGDMLYVYYAGAKVFDYYAPRVGLKDVEPIVGTMSRDDWFEYVADLEALRGKPRVWVVFMHDHKLDGVDEQKLFLMTLDRMGERLDRFEHTDAAAYLYDLSAGGKILARGGDVRLARCAVPPSALAGHGNRGRREYALPARALGCSCRNFTRSRNRPLGRMVLVV
jgi:hypothetical protein